MNSPENPALELECLRRRVAELEQRAVHGSTGLETGLKLIFDNMFEGLQLLDFDLKYLYLNNAAAEQGRCAREDLLGRRMADVYPGIEDTDMFRVLRACASDRVPRHMINHFEYPDGAKAWFDLRISPVPLGCVVMSIDISEQKSVEEELRSSREGLATTLECMTEAVITTDLKGCVTQMNPAAEILTGQTADASKGHLLDELVRFVDHDSQTPVELPVERILKYGVKVGQSNHSLLETRDGKQTPIASSGAPIRDSHGDVSGVVLVLKNMKEEYNLTAMLQRAQKMEALGRLAGGVAHDFNNLLTVVSGYSGMLLNDLAPDDPNREPVEEISKAGERAAALTRQLLAFSRQQVLEPKVLNMNSILGQTDGMLRRLIGEDVSLTTILGSDLGSVKVDPGQIEQVVLNLAVNARDAMPQGGRLTVETANVEIDETYARQHAEVSAGAYVMLAVSDNGCGMDDTTKARLFEPFFTTKGPGKGTGLGLATVFGIVKQSSGHIYVYSEAGYGTTFKIYLPAMTQQSETVLPLTSDPAPTGTETILLVEDEDAVRAVAVSSLHRFGYTVIAARGGQEAIEACDAYSGTIHLLISDVVMPDMGGSMLARAILARRPEIKVLYCSGYTDDAIVRHGILNAEAAFLQKPFTPNSLARKVREALGACCFSQASNA